MTQVKIEDLAELVERLEAAGPPCERADWERSLADNPMYLNACKLSERDDAGLIEIARCWVGLEPDDEPQSDALLCVSAWRGLAELRSADAVGLMLELLEDSWDDLYRDEWLMNDMPVVFRHIGLPALESLLEFVRSDRDELPRVTIVEMLHALVADDNEVRQRVILGLMDILRLSGDYSCEFNASIVQALLDLQAKEAAEEIERAFAAGHVQIGIVGTWQTVRNQLGVEGLGLQMPDHQESLEEARERLGINCFSARPIFGEGDWDDQAVQGYIARAVSQFAASEEGKSAIRRFDGINWTAHFLDFAAAHLGKTVDNMQVADAEEIVFEIFPRKVSCAPSSADMIVFEIVQFWKFVDRVHGLPAARGIVKALQGKERVLRAALADSSNYGMAKSIVMMGMEAGFDMTTEEGMRQFMLVYNASRGAGSALSRPTARPPMTAADRKKDRKKRHAELAKRNSGRKH